MQTILITGGAGFIGVNAAKHFLEKEWNVVVFDNLSRKGTEINLQFLQEHYGDRVKFEKGDVRTDIASIQALCESCDAVLHLAAQVAVTTSVVNPREDFDINALGTFNVLEAVRLSARKPIVIYASTNKVYGGLEDLPVEEGEIRYSFANTLPGVPETQPLDFHSPYGCSKGAADQYVRDYARLYDLKTVVLRQSCIYGPHQLGIEDQGWVAWFLIAAMFGKPVQVYGTGKQVRDLLYIDDLVRCYSAAIEQIDIAAGQVYNLGGGAANSLSLLEFLSILTGELGMKMEYTFADWRPGDQPIFISDNSKALKELGWSPKMEVHAGIKELHKWLTDNKSILEKFYT